VVVEAMALAGSCSDKHFFMKLTGYFSFLFYCLLHSLCYAQLPFLFYQIFCGAIWKNTFRVYSGSTSAEMSLEYFNWVNASYAQKWKHRYANFYLPFFLRSMLFGIPVFSSPVTRFTAFVTKILGPCFLLDVSWISKIW
jgi:hypothetical protein